jgi:hypothetical protein
MRSATSWDVTHVDLKELEVLFTVIAVKTLNFESETNV